MKKKRHHSSLARYLGFFLVLLIGAYMLFTVIFPSPTPPSASIIPQSFSIGILIAPGCTWSFWITDSVTLKPIQGARITIYWDDPLLGHAEYQMYTDQNGYATRQTFVYQWTYVRLEAAGYTTEVFGAFDSRGAPGQQLIFHWTMVSSGGSSGSSLIMYTQADTTRDDIRASVTYQGQTYYIDDSQYPASVQLWGLPVNSSINLELKGIYIYYVNGMGQSISFDWPLTIQTGNSTTPTEVWVDVMTGLLQSGKPPPAPPPPPDLWQILYGFIIWLTNYWYIAIILGIIVYLTPWWAPSLARSWFTKTSEETRPLTSRLRRASEKVKRAAKRVKRQ